jgi:hypothetical protein
MQVYKTRQGQNIYDVAVALYGSVEGLFDLMLNNPWLSFETELEGGTELYHDEAFVTHSSIVSQLASQNMTPVNGARHVYLKQPGQELRCIIRLAPEQTGMELWMAGDGTMTVDWGDNSELDIIRLEPTIRKYHHYFDNVTDDRRVKLYGDFSLRIWDMSTVSGLFLPVTPMTVDEVEMRGNNMTLQGLRLLEGTHSVTMEGIRLDDLSPIRDMDLGKLVLEGIDYKKDSVLDDYLIYIATHNNQRRGCKVRLDKRPAGEYREPDRDENGNYTIATGMEAIYVMTHEDAWNAASVWSFDICGETYEYENPNIA